MNGSSVSCPKCDAVLPETFLEGAELRPCPGCGRRLQVEAFPALFRPVAAGRFGEHILGDSEAGCFYHPDKRAVVPCANCGRFLCALCDVELDGQHLCPACLEAGQRKGELTQLENRRTLYDSAALTLALVPLLMWPVTLVTGPATVVLGIYAWNKPSSLIPRTKLRCILAILIGLVQTAGWGLLLASLMSGRAE
jgi:hypothetical protein